MVCPRKNPAALAAPAGSSAAPPTSSASVATLPAPPERMADGSDSSEARRGRISSRAAIPCASRKDDTCAPWGAGRTHEDQRRWQYREMVRRIGHGASHAARRVCFDEIRAEPPRPPPSRRARGKRAGVKQRSRAALRSAQLCAPALRSDHVTPVSKPSVPERAPALPEPQRAVGVAAGKLRAAMRSMHAIQARDAVWRRQRAATAARLPPRDAHVKAWRVARLHAVGEEARAALRCAEAARDAIELATRELAAARASDRAEILQLRTLLETSAVDQAELLRLREPTKTPAFDHAELLRHEGGLVRHQAALDMVYTELGELARARDDLRNELHELGCERDSIRWNLDWFKTSHREEMTSLHDQLAASERLSASGKTVDELSTRVDRIVRDMGCIWGQKWQNGHEFDNW